MYVMFASCSESPDIPSPLILSFPTISFHFSKVNLVQYLMTLDPKNTFKTCFFVSNSSSFNNRVSFHCIYCSRQQEFSSTFPGQDPQMISNCLGKNLCNLEFSDIHKYFHLCFSYAVFPHESPEPGRLASPLSQQKIPDGFQLLYVTHIHVYFICLKSSMFFFPLLFRSNASSKS